jgi:hypothetical protein
LHISNLILKSYVLIYFHTSYFPCDGQCGIPSIKSIIQLICKYLNLDKTEDYLIVIENTQVVTTLTFWICYFHWNVTILHALKGNNSCKTHDVKIKISYEHPGRLERCFDVIVAKQNNNFEFNWIITKLVKYFPFYKA